MLLITNPTANDKTMQPITKRQAFIDAAYSEIKKGEGEVLEPYVCTGGHPTIGVGKLFLSKNILKDKDAVERHKRQYMKFPLYDASNNKMTPEQKGKEFDNLVKAMKNGTMKTSGGTPNYIIYPKLGHITKEGAKQIFTNTCNYYLDKIEKDYGIEKFYSFPQSLQFSLLHCYMGGGRERLQKLKDLGKLNDHVEIAKGVSTIFDDHESAYATRNTAYQAISDTTAIKEREAYLEFASSMRSMQGKIALLDIQSQDHDTWKHDKIYQQVLANNQAYTSMFDLVAPLHDLVAPLHELLREQRDAFNAAMNKLLLNTSETTNAASIQEPAVETSGVSIEHNAENTTDQQQSQEVPIAVKMNLLQTGRSIS